MSVTASPTPSSPASLPGRVPAGLRYDPEPGAWDEMLAPDGSVRPHWRAFVELLEKSPPGYWQSCAAGIQRQLADYGVTYNIYGNDHTASRPWALDAVPFLIAQEEWERVAGGLHQRSRLLNAILSDMYVPQRLLRK